MKRKQKRYSVIIRHRGNVFSLLLFLCFLILFHSVPGECGFFKKGPTESKYQNQEEEVDHVSLAALMIKDGYFDRAEAILDQVDESDTNLDRARYHTLWGLVFLSKQQNDLAQQSFNRAIEHGQEDPIIFLYLAQSFFGLKEYQKTIDALEKAGNEIVDMPATYTMKAQCYWYLDQKTGTFNTLDAAISRFNHNADFQRQKVFYLIDLGLYQEAVSQGFDYLNSDSVTEKDYIAIGDALRKTKQLQKSLVVLETAHLKYRNEPSIIIALGHSYLENNQPLTAAKLFERAAQIDKKYISEAAELYRRARNYYRALYLNSLVEDQQIKIRQRLGILLEMESFEEAALLDARLSRLGLLEDEDVRYAMAYSFFKIGKFEEARKHIKKITRPDLFRAATELMKVMEAS